VDMIQLDFNSSNYFGAFYVSALHKVILDLAIKNDTELMVLDLIKSNAYEKKRLAQKGKWDIFLSIGGQYNFNEELGGQQLESYYEVSSDIVVKRFDRSVLLNTIQKSDADILYIDMTMKDRRIEMDSEIAQKKIALLIAKDQVRSSRKTLESWIQIHALKKEGFRQGNETVENYIQAFRSLIATMQEELNYENDYLDRIRDFDYICGKYFNLLGLDAY
jgi:outer membrane protein TolC